MIPAKLFIGTFACIMVLAWIAICAPDWRLAAILFTAAIIPYLLFYRTENSKAGKAKSGKAG